MTDVSVVERRFAALKIPNDAARERAPASISRAVVAQQTESPRGFPRRLRAALAACAVLIVVAVSPIGASIADQAEKVWSGEAPPEMQQELQEAQRTQDWWHRILLDTIAKAQADQLKADVNPQRVITAFTAALHPPSGAAGNQLEDEMIELTAKLRAAGDMPSVDESPAG